MEANKVETPAEVPVVAPETAATKGESVVPSTATPVLQLVPGVMVPAGIWPSRQGGAVGGSNLLEEALHSARRGDPGALARYLVLRRQPVVLPTRK